jgi:hypothetical protein
LQAIVNDEDPSPGAKLLEENAAFRKELAASHERLANIRILSTGLLSTLDRVAVLTQSTFRCVGRLLSGELTTPRDIVALAGIIFRQESLFYNIARAVTSFRGSLNMLADVDSFIECVISWKIASKHSLTASFLFTTGHDESLLHFDAHGTDFF